MRTVSKTAVIFVAAALSACTGSLLQTELPPNSLYVISPAPADPGAQTALPVDLTIGLPQLAAGLDTERIAVLKGRQLDYFRAARWGETTRTLLHSFMVDSFQDRGLFRSVTAEQARVASDYVLDLEVRDFQAEYANGAVAPTVRVALLGRLIRVVDRKLVATVSASSAEIASDNRLQDVTAAFETATRKVAADLVQQTASAISGDAASLSAARGGSQ